jgi:DMSO reductase anchor subunit
MEKKDGRSWLRRLGLAGFMFFLIKGLVWLAVFFGAFKMCTT